jgi:hypothetical protein
MKRMLANTCYSWLYYEMVKMLACPCSWDEEEAGSHELFLAVKYNERVKMLACPCC